MRILQLMNKVPWPPKDGGAIACLNMTKGFSMLGHEVTVLSMNTSKHHIRIKDMPQHIRSRADFRLVEVSRFHQLVRCRSQLPVFQAALQRTALHFRRI